MAFKFFSKTWPLKGEQQVNNGTLLNPEISIEHVVVKDGSVFIKFNATENGGVFKHNFNMQVEEPTSSDLNKLIESVMKDTFDV